MKKIVSVRRKERRRKKFLRLLSAILCICLLITACPYMPDAVVVKAAVNHSHAGWTAWSNTGAMPGSAGNYYLTSNVSLSGSQWTVPSGTTNLCLNGHTITQNGSARVVNVPSGATLNLYDEDNKGKITGGGTVDEGGGIMVCGSFTMNGGQVTGNTATGAFPGDGGAGIAVSGGQFTMNGGSVCDNHLDSFHGGGITVNDRGTVTITGGSITGNSARSSGSTSRSGGGVYIESGSSFEMQGGEISGNTAYDSGGGVNVDGTFTMSGGKITGNTAKKTNQGSGGGGIGDFGKVILTGGTISGNTASYGGGVLYSEWSKASPGLTLSGSPVINGNKNPDGAADNLYVDTHKSKYITIGSEKLKEGAHIGVKTQKILTESDNYDQLTFNCDNCSEYFVSDVAAYGIEYKDEKIHLAYSPHNYTYTSNGATITRKCSHCNASDSATLSISGNASRTYTGSAITPVAVTYSAGWVKPKPEVTYKNNINVGTATASLTVGGVTASLDFSITSADMSGVSASGYVGSYDGESHGITVTAPAGAVVKYGTSSGSYTETSSPVRKDAGTTTVYYQVTKANYKTVNGSAAVTINKCDISSASVTLKSGDLTYNGRQQTKEVNSVKVGSRTLASGTDYTVRGNTGTNAGDYEITIEGKGNYTGTKKVGFSIASAEMSGVSASGYNGTYDGESHGIKVTAPAGAVVKYGTSLGSYTKDSSPVRKDVGTTTVYYQVSKANYNAVSGSATVTINKCDISGAAVTLKSGDLIYNGRQQTKEVSSVKVGSRTLTSGTDYTVRGNMGTNAGTYEITIEGKGNYTGTKKIGFSIASAEMSGVSASGYNGTYDGESHGITVTAPAGAVVKYGTSSGSCTGDSSPVRKDAGTTTVYYQVTKANYKTVNGSAQVNVMAKSLTSDMVTITPDSYVYTGNAITPAVQVKDGSTALVKSNDYTVSYADNVKKGTATITITGKGNYTGTIDKNFLIAAHSIDGAAVTLDSTILTYNGCEQEKGVGSVVLNGVKLAEGTDYTISGHRQTNAGTYTITITGTGNYTGTTSADFKIAPKPLAADMITIAYGPHYYTGSAVTPAVTAEDSDISRNLVKDSDYVVSYADNVKKGNATVTVTGKGNYTGSIIGNFTIEYGMIPDGRNIADYVTISPEATDGWYNDDITLSPNSESGCSVGENPTGIGSTALIISQETGTDGSTETIYVKDVDGNIYQTEFFYKLDKTPPVIDLAGMMVENGTKSLWDWIIGKESMIIQIPVSDITDTSSGIAEVSYTVESGNDIVKAGILQAKGDYYKIALNAEFSGTIQLTAKDNAGNTTQTSLTSDGGKVIAEDRAPVVTFELPDGGQIPSGDEDGWYNTAVTITVNVTDDGDSQNAGLPSGGIAGIRWKEGENGEEQTIMGLPGDAPVYEKRFTIAVDTDGTHKYYVNAADNAGNESGWRTVTVKVDTEPMVFNEDPAVTNSTEEGADVTFIPSEVGKVYWIISDAGTPPTAQEVKEQSGDKGGIKDVTGGTAGSFTITGLTPGEKHTVYVVLEDTSGNLSEVKGESFFTQQKAPDITQEQLDIDYTKEAIKLPDNIGEVEIYTNPDNPSESKVTPNDDGSLPVTPGMEVYIRYPERNEDGLTVPASDKVTIQIPDRPVPTDKQVTVTGNAITLTNPDSKEEYVIVKKGEAPDWKNADTAGKFTGLDTDTEYDIYVRIKATENNFVSVPVKMEVRTKNHTLQKTKAVEATCTEAGNREYWTCSDCHKLFEDEQGKTETDSSKVIIQAAGHTFPEQWAVEKEATENEPGRQYKICEKCGIKIYRIIDPLGTPDDLYSGRIEKEVEVLPGAPDTVLNNSKEELAQSVLTEGEIVAVESGDDAKIWLEVTPDVDIDKEDKAEVQKAAVESMGAGAEVTYFDASLFKKVGKGEKTPIHYTDRPVSVTIVIPEDIRNKDMLMVRNYQIIRLHGGKIDIIEGTYKEESAEFTFETDKFSTYAICYKDIPKQSEPDTPEQTPEESTEPDTPEQTPEESTEPDTPEQTPEESTEPDTPEETSEETTEPDTPEETTEPEKPTSAPGEPEISTLLATGKQKGNTSIKLTWSKWKGASGYDVYWSYCDGKKNYKKLKTVKAKEKCTYTHKKLKKDRAYKYYIAAYKMVKGKKQYIAKSPTVHVAMKNEKHTNANKITLNKTKLVLSLTNKKYKKAFQIRVKIEKENSKKKILSHAAKLRYYTDDKTVAKVNRTGKITAKGRGTCTVYVIANNGVCKKITVTVK